MKFAIWLSAKTLGVESAKELSGVLGKRADQLSKWISEKPRPEFANIRLIAETVGISAAWLDDPSSHDAREPDEWAGWWAKRMEYLTDSHRRRA